MDVTKASTSKNSATFYTGFLLQFLNPKTVIFTLTVIPSYVLPYYNGFVPLTLNILGITVIAFIAFLLWILCGAIFKELLRKYSTITNSIMALFLVYAAVMIWF
ncbi:LysE family translocator [Geomicrobium sp. JCM 19055]|uniref:LysE family translocator n=1 Tax=Geomicrobium sp. JCM 19055 TaxID=1460649 RepID=UPI00351C0BB7